MRAEDTFGDRLRERKSNKGTFGTQARVQRSMHELTGRRKLSPRAGPGYYTPNDAATRRIESFEDNLRDLPLKNVTNEVVQLHSINRAIKMHEHKTREIDALPHGEDRLVRMVTDKDVAKMKRRRAELVEIVNAQKDQMATMTESRRSLIGSENRRPVSSPFSMTEERFFDPTQGQSTGSLGTLQKPMRLGNLEPSMYELCKYPLGANVAPSYDTFGVGGLATSATIPKEPRHTEKAKDMRLHVSTNGAVYGPFTGYSATQPLGPGEYDPATDVLTQSLGVADDMANVRSHYMNPGTQNYVYERSAPANATLLGLPPGSIPTPVEAMTQKLRDDHFFLGTKQRACGTESGFRPVPTGVATENTVTWDGDIADSLSDDRTALRTLARTRASRDVSTPGPAAVREDTFRDSTYQPSTSVSWRNSRSSANIMNASATVSLSRNKSMVSEYGMSRKMVKGPKHLPGR